MTNKCVLCGNIDNVKYNLSTTETIYSMTPLKTYLEHLISDIIINSP